MSTNKNVKKIVKDLQKKSDDTTLDATGVLKDLAEVVTLTARFATTGKTSKAFSGLALALSFGSVGKKVFDFYKQQVSLSGYSVKIQEEDNIFEIAEKWLMDAIPEDKQMSVFARSKTHVVGKKYNVVLDTFFDGTVTQEIMVNGHHVKIKTETPEKDASNTDRNNNSIVKNRSIIFYCPTAKAKNAVLTKLQAESQVLSTRKAMFWLSYKWGGNHRVGPIPSRSIDSVVLKEGQKERIFNHIDRFLKNEEYYNKIGIPYRTGMMFHGTPGSGKSSTASAIAHELNLDIYYISLSSLDDDDSLASCFNGIDSRSIILLEDIDVVHASKDRDNDKGITMSGLLNVLDGLQSPRGSIIIMTTNHLDRLDPAIVRKGRVDLTENLSELDDYQLRGLCEQFLGYIPEDLPSIENLPEEKRITSAQVVGILRDHIPDLDKAGPSIVEFVSKKVDTLQLT